MYKSFCNLAAAFLMAVSFVTVAHTAEWPTRPITVIIPYAAGSGSDNAFRIFRDQLATELKQPIVVQNTAGAGGIVGTIAIKQSENNGYTIGMSVSSTIGTGNIFNEKLPYDYRSDFEYIGIIGEIPRGVFVAANSPYNNVSDLIAASKNGVDLSFGISTNSPDQLNAVVFNTVTNGKSQVIPYSGNTNTMIVDLLGGRLHAVWQSLPAMSICLQDQSCKLLALTGSTKHSLYPTVPTFSELGYSNINTPSYYGVIAPVGVPTQQLEILNQALNKVISDPKVKDQLLKIGVVVTPKNLKETKQYHLTAVDVAKESAIHLQNKK